MNVAQFVSLWDIKGQRGQNLDKTFFEMSRRFWLENREIGERGQNGHVFCILIYTILYIYPYIHIFPYISIYTYFIIFYI